MPNYSVTLPYNEYFGWSASPVSLDMYAFQIGSYLSIFSGCYMSGTSGSVFEDVGISSQYNNIDQVVYSINLDNNEYLFGTKGISYQLIISSPYGWTKLNTYSSSTLGMMGIQTLIDLSIDPII